MRPPKYIVSFIVLIGFAFVSCDKCKSSDTRQISDPMHNTVWEPVVDGIGLDIPDELGNRELAGLGFADVTAAPFFADPTGKNDATGAIREAIVFARNHQMVCHFPAGTYKISDTLPCIQGAYRRSSGNILNARQFPCLLVGSGKNGRPKIILAPNSPGFDDPGKPKYVIHFRANDPKNACKPKPNVSMNQMMVNIDVVIGKGNSGAVAIRHHAAQGSGIQDCTIDATHGLTGIEGGVGSGGSLIGVTVAGGNVGLDLRETQPAPTLAGVTLTGQRETAILYSGMQSLSAVGLKIVSRAKGPLIKGISKGGGARGQICITDGRIEFEKTGGIAISAVRSLYLNNVYIKGASKAVANPDKSIVAGNENGWMRILEYAHGGKEYRRKIYKYKAPVYIDGKRKDHGIAKTRMKEMPPANLQSRHLWEKNFPDWESDGVANAKAPPYNAKGDGHTDDSEALQHAVLENEIVFLPKGYYCVTKPIRLRPDTKLIGAGRHLSIIMVRNDFNSAKGPEPLLQTGNDKNAETVLASFGIYVPHTVKNAYALKWECGGDSLLRAVNFMTGPPLQGYGRPGKPEQKNYPLVLVTGNGGGRWFNFFQESYRGHGPKYRHLEINAIKGPFAIYQCNPEHARGEANMEIRRSKNISIYGLKSEGNRAVVKIVDSDNIRVFGYGGNASALEDNALFVISGTPNFLIANALDSPRLPPIKSSNPGFGRGVDPTRWHMIREYSGSSVINTLPCDRPVLYKRGDPPGEP